MSADYTYQFVNGQNIDANFDMGLVRGSGQWVIVWREHCLTANLGLHGRTVHCLCNFRNE